MKFKGFSLFEFIVVLALTSILLVLSVASYHTLIEKNEKQVLIDTISNAIHYSKLRAIQLGRSLYLLPLNTTAGWTEGVRLVTAARENRAKTIVHEWHWKTRNWSVSWSGVNSIQHIKIAESPLHAMSNGRFILENKSRHEKVVLVLNRLGRIKRT